MKDKSTAKTSRRKAPKKLKKPSKDFPLSIHQGSGYWCRKVHGRVYYFGKVADDPKGVAALEKWLDEKDDLYAGREPRAKVDDELIVADLCNQFLQHKQDKIDSGEMTLRTFRTYYDSAAFAVKVIGKNRNVDGLRPDDFAKLRSALAKTRGAVALRNEIVRVRSIFKFAFDSGLILAPIRFGQSFALPENVVIRRAREAHRSEHGPRMLQAVEIRELLAAAKPAMKAMILLGANCGFGQTDLSNLPTRAVNLDTGWIDFARVKTAVPRRIPLWAETISAIYEWLPLRPKAKDAADGVLLFLTVRGARWVKTAPSGASKDAVGQEFNKLLNSLGLKRHRLSFYALRHTFETVAGETADQVAVDAIMGHVPQGMAAAYRERIGDDRLLRVVEHVRRWLFADDTTAPKKNREFCDPTDPCDPRSSKTLPGICDPIAPCDPPETGEGRTGLTGSKIRNSFSADDSPALRLFVG